MTIKVHEVSDHVTLVEMCRPDENYLNIEVVVALADAVDKVVARGGRAVVLASRGKHFCAGVDFSDASKSISNDGMPKLYEEALRLFDQPLPIVCAVQGAAIGGGLGLALLGDFRVAAPEARFAANFAQLGLHHGFGLTVTLPRVVGEQAAMDLLYTGRRIDGEQAVRLGLADHLAPLADVRPVAIAKAEAIAISAPMAVRAIRQTMRGGLAQSVREALVRERTEQRRLQQTADFREGIAAMAERRTPKFQGA